MEKSAEKSPRPVMRATPLLSATGAGVQPG